ncbi:MAG: extracellular solute-binding protein, partial [Oscillospiraceae bacterium]|nr:extracellular solute-binding protein [Oscillospiraceae bacterium]
MSRKRLAEYMKLTPPAITKIVAEMLQEGLLREGSAVSSGAVGRREILVELNTHAACGAGNFACGYVPYAFIEGIDTILTNAPSHWAVYKDGNVAEAEEFLNWLAGPDGQQIMVQEAGCVSPFKSCTVVANDPFAAPVSEYAAAG